MHQAVLGALAVQVWNFLSDKPGEVYMRPFGVRLFERDGDSPTEVDTYVEPDIVTVLDTKKLDKMGCIGAPDYIIEIVSPATYRHDVLTKLRLYERAKVREYWIAAPPNGLVTVYLLEDDKFVLSEVYTRKDKAPITVLPGCEIDLSKVFTEEYI